MEYNEFRNWEAIKDELDELEFNFETKILNDPKNPWMLALENILGTPEFRFSAYFPTKDKIRLLFDEPQPQEHRIGWEGFHIPINILSDITVEDAIGYLMEQLQEHCEKEMHLHRMWADNIQWLNDEMISTNEYKRFAHYNIMMEDDYRE